MLADFLDTRAAVSVIELSEISGLSIPTIRRYILAGKIPVIQISAGGRTMIPVSYIKDTFSVTA